MANYIVCGFPAGGTSMMMRVMIEGGIKGNYKLNNNERMLRNLHNPHGTFEGFDKDKMDNHVSKVFSPLEIKELCKGVIKIVFINRNSSHIIQSRQERRLRMQKTWSRQVRQVEFNEKTISMLNELKERRLKELSALENCEILMLDFEKVNEQPKVEIKKIAEFIAPHPFDINKAVLAIDKSLYTKRT